MRKLLSYDTQPQATKLQALLTVNKIDSRCTPTAGQWDIWILDEDQIESARRLANKLEENPDSEEFRTVQQQAQAISDAEQKEMRLRQKQARQIQIQQQRNHTRPAKSITRSVILLCSVLFGAALLSGPNGFINNALGVAQNASIDSDLKQRVSKTFTQGGRSLPEAIESVHGTFRDSYNSHWLVDIKRGQIWRLITPIFLHGSGDSGLGGILHIFFNMYWLYVLGLVLEIRFGPKNYILLILVTGVASVLIPAISPTDGILHISGLKGGPVVGFSGVIYGFIGFGWIKTKLQPSLGILIPPFILIFMMIWLAIGFIPTETEGSFLGRISHLAHIAGLLAGVGYGYLHTKIGK